MHKSEIQQFLNISIHHGKVDYDVLETLVDKQYNRLLISYKGSESDEIRAYLFIPQGRPIIGSILVHHQHNGERHLGKSEVAGIVGDPFQAFCPELAKKGIICLAPDSVSFEDRRTNATGYEISEDPDDDVLQHYNEMAYRLLHGTTLMKKVVEDSSIGISLLAHLDETPENKISILGHSYGGNTVIFHSPFDERIKYSCSSGAVGSYRIKMEKGIGIELAEVIPGFVQKFDIDHLIKCVCPRSFLIVAGTEDPYALDADDVYSTVKDTYMKYGVQSKIELQMYEGGHPLDSMRFEFIINWFLDKFS